MELFRDICGTYLSKIFVAQQAKRASHSNIYYLDFVHHYSYRKILTSKVRYEAMLLASVEGNGLSAFWRIY